MKIIIEGDVNEIADFVVALQNRQRFDASDFKGVTEGIIEGLESGFQDVLTTICDTVSEPQRCK